jgi:hypothetical protein
VLVIVIIIADDTGLAVLVLVTSTVTRPLVSVVVKVTTPGVVLAAAGVWDRK